MLCIKLEETKRKDRKRTLYGASYRPPPSLFIFVLGLSFADKLNAYNRIRCVYIEQNNKQPIRHHQMFEHIHFFATLFA